MVQQLLVCLIFLFASLIYSIFGFGFSMIAIPLLSMILGPKLAISLKIFLGMFLNFYLFYLTYSEMEFREIIKLLIGSIFGILLGVKILLIINSELINIFINILIIVTVIIFKIKRNYQKFSNKGKLEFLVGFLSGFFGSSTGIPGPPIIMFGLSKKWEKKKLRANFLGFFAIYGVFTNIGYFIVGFTDLSKFVMFIVPSIIGISFGTFAGKNIFKYIKSDVYSSSILVLILVIACFGLIEVFLDFIKVVG